MNRSETTADAVINYFEETFADIRRQSAWDFSGKQIYLGNRHVTKICLALDPILANVKQAIDGGCEILITHHPLFFTSQKGINTTEMRDRIIATAIKNDLTILSYHTNLDMAPEGLNSYLVNLLGAKLTGLFGIEGEVPHSVLSVYVPHSHEKAVIDALAAAGAGKMGNYSRCAFSAKGTGTFTPKDGSNPYIGQAGKTEYVEETRVDMLLPNDKIGEAVAALRESHPYEEPAFYIMPTKSPLQYSAGRTAAYETPLPFKQFIEKIKEKLSINHLGINMPSFGKPVEKFAVVTGSGASMWKECLSAGIDLLITGDMKHHDALDAREAGVCIIDAGHFATEKIYMNRLAAIIHEQFNVETILADETPPISII